LVRLGFIARLRSPLFFESHSKAFSRGCSLAFSRRGFRRSRRAGIAAVHFDLLYGPPHHTVESCRDTVRQALTPAPDRLAVFDSSICPL